MIENCHRVATLAFKKKKKKNKRKPLGGSLALVLRVRTSLAPPACRKVVCSPGRSSWQFSPINSSQFLVRALGSRSGRVGLIISKRSHFSLEALHGEPIRDGLEIERFKLLTNSAERTFCGLLSDRRARPITKKKSNSPSRGYESLLPQPGSPAIREAGPDSRRKVCQAADFCKLVTGLQALIFRHSRTEIAR